MRMYEQEVCCSMKVRIIREYNNIDLEAKTNEFLAYLKELKVNDIKITSHGDTLVATVMYGG